MTPSAQLEAVLFAAGEPLAKKKLAVLLGATPDQLEVALGMLRKELHGRGITLVEVKDEVELRTAADATPLMKKLREGGLSRDLGKAGLEALAVVLYRKDGATRSEIDWIRGVNSSAIVRSLLLRGLVERVEDPADRRKLRYRATTETLAHLGIGTLSELPRYEELAHEAAGAIAATSKLFASSGCSRSCATPARRTPGRRWTAWSRRRTKSSPTPWRSPRASRSTRAVSPPFRWPSIRCGTPSRNAGACWPRRTAQRPRRSIRPG